MGNLFGVRRRAPVVTAQDRAVLQMKQQRDKIKIYQKRTETELEKNKELALNLYQNGMKDRAIIVLRRKKNMEEILIRTDKQLETLEQLVADIEFTQIQVSVVEGLKVGAEALKQLNSLIDIDDLQQMMEDNEEAAEKQREISNILNQTSERYDEDDLIKELKVLQGKLTTKEDEIEVLEPTKEQVNTSEETKQVVVEKGPKAEATETSIESKIDDLPQVPEDTPKLAKPAKSETRQMEPAQ